MFLLIKLSRNHATLSSFFFQTRKWVNQPGEYGIADQGDGESMRERKRKERQNNKRASEREGQMFSQPAFKVQGEREA